MPQIPALLSLVESFTLDKRLHEFDFVHSNLQAVLSFIRYEISKLQEPTMHYTYLDGQSVYIPASKVRGKPENRGTRTGEYDVQDAPPSDFSNSSMVG